MYEFNVLISCLTDNRRPQASYPTREGQPPKDIIFAQGRYFKYVSFDQLLIKLSATNWFDICQTKSYKLIFSTISKP